MPRKRSPLALWADVQCRMVSGGGLERGDVPGAVLVTLMTAGLVTIVWALTGSAIGDAVGPILDR